MLVEFVVSTAYGLVSAVVPVLSSEVYVVAARVSGLAAEVSAALGVALGQSVGKMVTVVAVRRGLELPWIRRRRNRPRAPAGPVRARLRSWSDRLLELMSDRRWGVLVVFSSALVSVPPLYALTFAVPESKMSVWLFGGVILLGRSLLLLAIAFGVTALVGR